MDTKIKETTTEDSPLFIFTDETISCSSCGGEVALLESEIEEANRRARLSKAANPLTDASGNFIVSPPVPTGEEISTAIKKASYKGRNWKPANCGGCKTQFIIKSLVDRIAVTGLCESCERYTDGEINHIHIEPDNYRKYARLRERRAEAELADANGFCLHCFDSYECANCAP